MRRILEQTASERQVLLFSATLDGAVGKLAAAVQRQPIRHEVGAAGREEAAEDEGRRLDGRHRRKRPDLVVAWLPLALLEGDVEHGPTRLAVAGRGARRAGRPADEGVPALIRIARTHKDPATRRQALVWLGRSDDARAMALFEELLLAKR